MDYIRMYVFNGNIIANSKKHGNEKIKFWQKKQAKHCGTALFVVKCCEISQKREVRAMWEALAASAAAFAATNVDDLFVLMLLFGQAESRPLSKCEGRVAACHIAPYPPGVPVAAPGERLGKKHLAYLQEIGYNMEEEIRVLLT